MNGEPLLQRSCSSANPDVESPWRPLRGDPSVETLEGQHYSDNALSETEVDCILSIVQLV